MSDIDTTVTPDHEVGRIRIHHFGQLVTLATMFDGVAVHIGASYCSPSEVWSRRIARSIATARMIRHGTAPHLKRRTKHAATLAQTMALDLIRALREDTPPAQLLRTLRRYGL